MNDWDLIIKHAPNRPKTRMGFARHLNEIDPTHSVKGWEMAIYRWEQAGKPDKSPVRAVSQPLPHLTSEWLLDRLYHYDKATDTYLTQLPKVRGIIAVPGEVHRAMLEDYSDASGSSLTVRQLAEKYNFPARWMNSYRTIHGWSHASDPFTDEQILSEHPETLKELLAQSRRNDILDDMRKKEAVQQKKDAEAYRDMRMKWLDEFLKLIPEERASVPVMDMRPSDSPYAVVISPTDFHWGKHGWVDEVGDGYDLATAEQRLFDKTNELICRLPGRPDEIILATGSDWFHVDTDTGTTTRGTPQDMATSPAEILMTGCDLARQHIDLLRQVAPVRVTFMPGNHDRHSTFALMMYLSAYYRNEDDVTVIVSPKTRQYLTYGDTLLGFTHGDKLGPTKLGPIMATEAREDWGKHTHHLWFHGHLHHQTLTERDGVTIIQLPSLAGHDRYHYRSGYTMSNPGLAAHIIDMQHGLIGSLFAGVQHDNP
jgi:hypothetical protein